MGAVRGRYALLLQECLKGALAGYVGLDAKPHAQWDEYRARPGIELICADAGATKRYRAAADLIFTQSALETFVNDIEFFMQIATHVSSTNRPTLQLHLVPSGACLATFRWHGVRQYTPRTISRITRLSGPETSRYLYYLGSAACNRVHRRYIIYPCLFGLRDRRERDLDTCERDLRQAVQDDEAGTSDEACFHALVLQARVQRDIFAAPRTG